jgi:transcriptional regulator with XRE-family HTH domain
MTFGKRLLRLREARGIDQAKLGEILNLSKSTISMYEKDQRSPSPETIVLIAEYFKTTTDYLLRGDTRAQDEIIKEEVNDFLEEYNNLSEFQQKILMERIEELTNWLKQMPK